MHVCHYNLYGLPKVKEVLYSFCSTPLPTDTLSVIIPYWFRMGGTQYARRELAMTPSVLTSPKKQVIVLLGLKHRPDMAINLPPRLLSAIRLNWIGPIMKKIHSYFHSKDITTNSNGIIAEHCMEC